MLTALPWKWRSCPSIDVFISTDGNWESGRADLHIGQSWQDYTPCLPPPLQHRSKSLIPNLTTSSFQHLCLEKLVS